jgi:hypothetical protein
VCAYAYISEDYTRACDIIRRKGGTKNSVELSIEELAYNAKENYLELQKFYVSASTLLGSYNDGTEVAEGMIGSRADIVDFSEKNNSVLSDRQELINEVATAVIKQLSDKKANFADYNYGKEEIPVDKENVNVEFEEANTDEVEVKEEMAETVEVETTEEETLVLEAETSDEDSVKNTDETPEVVNEFADDDPADDLVDEGGSESDPTDNPTEETTEDEHQSTSAIEDEDSTGTRVENSLEYSATFNGKTRSCFATLNEQLEALWVLVNDTYGESDNEWYSIDADPEKKLVYMHGWNNNYRQSYKVKNDVFSLTGDRVRIYPIWVSEDEKKEIENMKFNYSSIESELNSYKAKELHSAREAVLASDDYSVMADFEEFKDLKSHMDEYSVEELTNKADLVYAKFMKSNYSTFAANEQSKKRSMVFMASSENTEEERLPYGGLFKNFKSKK